MLIKRFKKWRNTEWPDGPGTDGPGTDGPGTGGPGTGGYPKSILLSFLVIISYTREHQSFTREPND